MDAAKRQANVINPWGIFREALGLWGKNLVPLVAVNAVTILAQIGLKQGLAALMPSKEAVKSGDVGVFIFVLLGASVVVLIFVNSFLSLVSFSYVRGERQAKPFLLTALKDAASRIAPFLKSVFLFWAFVVVGVCAATFFLVGGQMAYTAMSQGASQAAAVGVLLVTSTIFVVVTIAVAWYSFFFSLGPLAAAYENMPAALSFKASRNRIRGQALRYLATLGITIVFYLFIGLGIYGIITRFTHDKFVLDVIDPVMMFFCGPLGLVIWYVVYKKVTELKK